VYLVTHCNFMWAHWRHQANTIELVLPSAHPSPQPIRQIDQFSCFCTAHGRKSLHTLQRATLSPKIASSHAESGLPYNSWFLARVRAHNLNGITISSAVFGHVTAECPYTLQWGTPFHLKIDPSHGGIWTPIWSPGPTWALNPNGISIGSTVFFRAH